MVSNHTDLFFRRQYLFPVRLLTPLFPLLPTRPRYQLTWTASQPTQGHVMLCVRSLQLNDDNLGVLRQLRQGHGTNIALSRSRYVFDVGIGFGSKDPEAPVGFVAWFCSRRSRHHEHSVLGQSWSANDDSILPTAQVEKRSDGLQLHYYKQQRRGERGESLRACGRGSYSSTRLPGARVDYF
jgi:hypothetical protein